MMFLRCTFRNPATDVLRGRGCGVMEFGCLVAASRILVCLFVTRLFVSLWLSSFLLSYVFMFAISLCL
jgi:hypothetical protein